MPVKIYIEKKASRATKIYVAKRAKEIILKDKPTLLDCNHASDEQPNVSQYFNAFEERIYLDPAKSSDSHGVITKIEFRKLAHAAAAAIEGE